MVPLDASDRLLVALGIDEVGRGPLAGPLVAAGVVLDPEKTIDGLNDSKKLSASVRERLAKLIHERAVVVSIAEVDAETIDKLNIHRATLLAMRHVVADAAKRTHIDCALIDGRDLIPTTIPIRQKAIVKGDSLVPCIMAASIVAKVYRDALMDQFDQTYPSYGFRKHKGYGTKAHRQALKDFGPSPIHRMSFMALNQLELL